MAFLLKIPIHGEDGSVAGLINTTTETSQQKLYERRSHILRMLGDKTGQYTSDRNLFGCMKLMAWLALARSKTEFAEFTREVLTEEAVVRATICATHGGLLAQT